MADNEEVIESQEEITPEASDAAEEQQEQVEETEAQQEETQEVEQETEEPEPISRRKAQRLEKLESLVEKIRGGEQPSRPDVKGMNYSETLTADPELIQQLEADREATATASYNQGLERAKSIQFHTRLEIDAPRIEAKYAVLDKASEDFNPALANSINSWYLAAVGFDPKTDTVANAGVRYSDFVEGIMEVADQMAGEKNTRSAQNIAKQAASTGLRPDGSTAKRLNLNKPPQQMTDEELKAVIGQAGL